VWLLLGQLADTIDQRRFVAECAAASPASFSGDFSIL